jgi:hypothetical protein
MLNAGGADVITTMRMTSFGAFPLCAGDKEALRSEVLEFMANHPQVTQL